MPDRDSSGVRRIATGVAHTLGAVTCALAVVACGGEGSAPSSELGTLAYVQTVCRDDATGFTVTQELRVQRGDAAPLTVVRLGPFGPIVSGVAPCGYFAERLVGVTSVRIGAFQRIGMSPDATGIVFEVSDDFNLFGLHFVPPEQEGIFFIRTDGSGLRRLGRASGAAASQESILEPQFLFSPNGRLVGFTDMGPGGPEGKEAAQAFTLNVETGERTQVTDLPPALEPGIVGSGFGRFLDDHTILFYTTTNPDGLNPTHDTLGATISVDGGAITPLANVALPGGVLIPIPTITGARRVVGPTFLPGMAVNPIPDFPASLNRPREVFIYDGMNALQLTDFRRTETAASDPQLGVNGERVFFTASVDLGSNPTQACQVFSVDALGGAFQQLTHFTSSERLPYACIGGGRCRTDFNFGPSQDRRNGLLLFSSTCDPFSTNTRIDQIFALRPDGSALRQLTDARGVVVDVTAPSIDVERPGPWAYGPYLP